MNTTNDYFFYTINDEGYKSVPYSHIIDGQIFISNICNPHNKTYYNFLVRNSKGSDVRIRKIQITGRDSKADVLRKYGFVKNMIRLEKIKKLKNESI